MIEFREQGWRQMRFVSPEGRHEILWVDSCAESGSGYRVLNVPVWLYDISVGTVVEGRAVDGGHLEFVRVLEESTGGTVRLIVPRGAPDASRLYLDHLLAECEERGILIGPATFFDPRLVAIHVQDWEMYHEPLVAYLEGLIATGVIQEWEIGDPAHEPDGPPEPVEHSSELVHPRPGPRRPYVRAS